MSSPPSLTSDDASHQLQNEHNAWQRQESAEDWLHEYDDLQFDGQPDDDDDDFHSTTEEIPDDVDLLYNIPFALPPANRDFASIDAAWEFLDAWTAPRGYGLRLRCHGPKDINGQINSIYLCCDRRNPRNKPRGDNHIRKRFKATKTQDCDFKMVMNRDAKTNRWTIRCTNSTHTYRPSWSTTAGITHSSIRRRRRRGQVTEFIEEQMDQGTGLRDTIRHIHSFYADIPVLRQDVLNERKRHR